MGRHFRIRVRGKPRQHLDPDLLAQVVILYGRQLARQRRQHIQSDDQSNEDGLTLDKLGDKEPEQ